MLAIALALDFFFRPCILAVIATMVRLFRNRTTALRVATLFVVCHTGSPLYHKSEIGLTG
jgi:hypothetical protein